LLRNIILPSIPLLITWWRAPGASSLACLAMNRILQSQRYPVKLFWNQHPLNMAKDLFTADGDGIQSSAVKGVPHGDGFVTAGDQTGQSFGQVHGHLIGITAGAEGQGVELLLDCADDLGIGKTDLVCVVSVKIHVAAALQVFNVNAVTGFKGIETRGGQGLSQEIALILFEKVPGGSVYVLILPFCS